MNNNNNDLTRLYPGYQRTFWLTLHLFTIMLLMVIGGFRWYFPVIGYLFLLMVIGGFR